MAGRAEIKAFIDAQIARILARRNRMMGGAGGAGAAGGVLPGCPTGAPLSLCVCGWLCALCVLSAAEIVGGSGCRLLLPLLTLKLK